MSTSIGKSVKTGIQSARTMETKIHHKLESYTTKMVIRVLLIVHILVTKYLPEWYLGLINNLSVRIILALFVVYLAFIDIISASLLAMLFIFAVQEVNSRKAAVATTTAVLVAVARANNVPTTTSLAAPTQASTTTTIPPGVIVTDQIPVSSYGNAGALVVPGSSVPGEDYAGQVGDLSITKEIAAGRGVQVVNGVASIKVNMDQISNSGSLAVGNYNPQSDIEGFVSQSANNSLPTDEYDHPATKTLTENVRVSQTGYVTPKNLVDAQVNSAQGVEVQDTIPASIGTWSPVWNAQGMSGELVTAGLDPSACGYSSVV